MIPVKLKMHNFMCYRDNVPPLHFDGIHIACISGDNGNGKSALIDAATWALWGKTRAKSDDDLVHQGQREMEVEFDFAVGQQLYRIIRKHSQPKRRRSSGQTILELQIAAGDGFRSISGNSVTQTQQKIIDLLHMDYATFINSAFLRQGHADEFTQQPPTRRKEVLANILGLSVYDGLEEQAKNLVRQQEVEVSQLESAIRDIDSELNQKPAYQTEFEAAQAGLSYIEQVVKEQDARLNCLRQEKESLENKKWQLAELEERLKDTEKALQHWDEQIKQHRSRLKEYEELFAQRSAIEDGYTQLSEARKLNDELGQKLVLLTKLNEHKNQLERAVERAQAVLTTEHALAQEKIKELELISRQLPRLKNELYQLQVQQQQLSELEATLRQKRQTRQELQTQVNYLESSQTQLERNIGEIEEKLKLLLAQSDAKCPLCERELGRDGLNLITTKYTTDRLNRANSLKSNQDELEPKKVALKSLDGEVSRLETKLNQDRASFQAKTSLLNQEIAEAEEATEKLVEAKKRRDEIEQRLNTRDFATREQVGLRELEGELARLDYDPQRHEEVRTRLTHLEKYESPKRKLDEAVRLVNQEKEALSRAEEAARELCQSLEIERQKRQGLTAELGRLPRLVEDFRRAETEYQALVSQQKQAQETVGIVKAKLQRCADLEIKRREKESRLTQVRREEKIYRELAQAFGKKGIQAMLIETALPEIEVEANRLLGRMTDNRMHVKIETQRETKKGDLRETLDIKISDELGTRNYEMFSGGEAFRINFAIRIALSKLLARRAGAPLRTLIIDEGFGTQDNTGIEKLKEAINSIQDDFDRILVITHIDELKDAFPTRIDVIKTAEGSTIEIG